MEPAGTLPDVSQVSLGNVLVVGGSGFLGTHCVKQLLRSGASSVHTLNSHIPGESRKIPGVEYHAVDLGDAAGVEQAVSLAQPDVVVHTASPRPFVEWPATYERVNVQGIRNILAACDAVGTTKAFVYCSSVSVIYDGWHDLTNADESWPVLYAPQQRSPYWHSKAVGERLVLHHNRQNAQKMLTTALRVTSIFGEDDEQIIGGMVRGAKSGQTRTQIGNGKNLNSWTYVGNIVEAHVLAARRLLRAVDRPDPPEHRVEGEAFFVTNNDPRPFWDFARQVAAEAGYPVKPEEVKVLPAFMAYVIGFIAEWYVFATTCGQRRSSICRDQMHFCVVNQTFNTEKARRQLGYLHPDGRG